MGVLIQSSQTRTNTCDQKSAIVFSCGDGAGVVNQTWRPNVLGSKKKGVPPEHFRMADVWSVKLENRGLKFRIRKTGLSSMGDMLLYAFSLEAPRGNLDSKKLFL